MGWGAFSVSVNDGLEGSYIKHVDQYDICWLNYWYTLVFIGDTTMKTLSHKNCTSRVERAILLACVISLSFLPFQIAASWRLKKWDFLPRASSYFFSPFRAEIPTPSRDLLKYHTNELNIFLYWIRSMRTQVSSQPKVWEAINGHIFLGSRVSDAKGTDTFNFPFSSAYEIC